MIEKLMRVKEVSGVTGEDVMTTYRRIRAGEIKTIKIGKRGLRVKESELKRWLNMNNER